MPLSNKIRPATLDRRMFLSFTAAFAAAAMMPLRFALTGDRDLDNGDLPVTGHFDERLASFDRMMTSFVTLNEIPGAALAVTKDSRLVYARGFGFADAENRQPVQPQSLFRVASVSKPVTGVATYKLVDDGKLRLDDRVLDFISLEPHLEEGASMDTRWKDVTIQQLLQHTGGWDRSASFDPMFRAVEFARALSVDPPAKPEHVIRCMLGKPLDFAPGQKIAYSNFGYCLLGRVIEQATGKSYEKYVRDEILKPLGVTRMRVGKTLPCGRAEGEVTYDERGRTGPSVFAETLDQQVPLPYGAWHLEAMDSHGGWIASAIDLVRFAAALDRPNESKMLSRRSIRSMFARPGGAAGYETDGKPKGAFYGGGWNVRPVGNNGAANHWHGGSLDGTASWLVRRHDGLNWAALFNCRSGVKGEHLGEAVDVYIHRAADRVGQWPDHDLFAEYLSE